MTTHSRRRRRRLCADIVVGLAVGLAAALAWHAFTAPVYRGSGVGTMSLAYETEFVILYRPAPAWAPTVYVFPVISAALFSLLGIAIGGRNTHGRVAAAPTIRRNGALGAILGLGIAAWAHLAPPTFHGLTEDSPLWFDDVPQQYLWLIFPALCAATAIAVSAVIGIRRQSQARRESAP